MTKHWLLVGLATLFVASCSGSNPGSGPNPDAGIPDGGEQPDTGPVPSDIAPYEEGDPLTGYTEGECSLTPVAEPFEDPDTELHWDATGLPFPDHVHAIVSPVVVDFIDPNPADPTPEIIFPSYESFNGAAVLRVVSGSPPYATIMTLAGDGSAPNTGDDNANAQLQFDGHPAAGDLDGDGEPEIVAIRNDAKVVAFKNDGTELWRTAAIAPQHTTAGGAVSIADLDQDGMPEVIIGRLVLNGQTGVQRWLGNGGNGKNGQGPLSCVADLGGTPGMEVIAGNTVYDKDGNIEWESEHPTNYNSGFCAIADVINNDTGAAGKDGIPEVIRVAGHADNPVGKLLLHETRLGPDAGKILLSVDLPACGGGIAGAGGAPTVADFDGDGLAEIGVAGGTCYTVFDPACPGDTTLCPSPSPETNILWKRQTDDSSSNVTSSTVFDFNGDGSSEVIYNDEQRFTVLSGHDGAIVFEDWNPSRTRTEQPVVADVDNDGNAEIVFTANSEANFAGDDPNYTPGQRIPGVEIWSSGDDAWVPARPIWNQHTYHIDNINLDGTVPQTEVASWTTHNTYRANAPLDNSFSAPDLANEWGTVYCADNKTYVCTQLLNKGDVRVGKGIKVEFFSGDPDDGGTLIGQTESSRGVDPGKAGEFICIEWATPRYPADIYVRIDGDASERECEEDNNQVHFTSNICDGDPPEIVF